MDPYGQLENLFFPFLPEPKGQLAQNLVGSIEVTCRSKKENHSDQKSKIAAMVANLEKLFFPSSL